MPASLVMPGWQDVRLQTLCLDVQQSYPEIGPHFSLPVEPALRRLLAGLGIRVVDRGQACDATLSLSLQGEALERKYNICLGAPCGTCFTGAQISGEMVLARSASAPWKRIISARISPPSYVNACPKAPQEAPLAEVWPRAVLHGLFEMWGMPVMAVGIEDPDENVREAAVRLLENQGQESVPLLVQALQDRSAEVREQAARVLGTLGAQASAAVPALIEVLDDSSRPVRISAAGALHNITGQNFGQDQASWRKWLQEPSYKPTPVTDWRGLPVMPGAASMEELGDLFQYVVEASCGEVVAFYQAEMTAAGWTFTRDDGVAGVSQHLHFEKGGHTAEVHVNDISFFQGQTRCNVQLFLLK